MWTLSKVLDKSTSGFAPGETITRFFFLPDGKTVDFVETNLSLYQVNIPA